MILLIEPLGTNCSEIFIETHRYSFKKMHLRMSSGKWRPFCLGLNVLINFRLIRKFHPTLSCFSLTGFNWLPLGDLNVILGKLSSSSVSVIDGLCISCEIASSWMSVDLNDDKSTMVQVMAWYLMPSANKLLPEPMLAQIFIAIWCHYATIS